MDGKLWKSQEMDGVEVELDLSELPAGVYLLQHLNAEGTRTLKLALTK